MAKVRRYVIVNAYLNHQDVNVAGMGLFTSGVLDVPVDDTDLISFIESQLNVNNIISTGIVDVGTLLQIITAGPSLSTVDGIVAHDGSPTGPPRPVGFFRVRWIGGATRPTNMAAGDIWEHDA